MKRLSILLSLWFIVSCTDPNSKTRIAKNQLGALTPETPLKELSVLLEQDSVAAFNPESNSRGVDEVEVFNQEGHLSLIIEPNFKNDSIITIDEIQILDPKYKTKKGLSIDSKFKTIYENYKLDNIQNSINSVIISINEIGAYIVIDKKHLPSELRYDSEAKIEANQIPDDAPIKYFWLRFESPQID